MPVKNSRGGINLKNRIDSKITENTMPIVVIMAITEQAPKPANRRTSTAFLALNAG